EERQRVNLAHLKLVNVMFPHAALDQCRVHDQVNAQVPAKDDPRQRMQPAEQKMMPSTQQWNSQVRSGSGHGSGSFRRKYVERRIIGVGEGDAKAMRRRFLT